MASDTIEVKDCEEVATAYSCCVCLELFKHPKILPNCGHSFCLQCIENIWTPHSEQIKCPECRVVSSIGPAGPRDLKTNFQLQRLVEMYNSSKEVDHSQGDSPSQTCHHLDVKPRITCRHCSEKFCRSCEIVHKEKLKFEVLALADSISDQFEALTKNRAFSEAKKFIEKQKQEKIKLAEISCKQILSAVTSALQSRSNRIIKAIESAANSKLSQLEEAKNNARKTKLPVEIKQLPYQSSLNASLEEIAELRDSVLTCAATVKIVEVVKSDIICGSLIYKEDGEFQEKLFSIINDSNFSDDIKWKTGEEIENEELEKVLKDWHQAAKTGDLSGLQSTINKRKWADGTLQRLYNHSDSQEDNFTALMRASVVGSLEVVKFLAEECHANLLSVSLKNNRSICHIAVEHNHLDVVRYLIELEPRFCFLRDKLGATILHYAVVFAPENASMVQLLLDHGGVDLEASTRNGQTALNLAVIKGLSSVANLLLIRGANPGPVGPLGRSCLHVAAFHGRLDIVEHLLEHKPELAAIADKSGKLPKDLALNQMKPIFLSKD